MLSDYLNPQFPHPRPVRYALSFLIFLLALALRFAILPIEDRLAYATFYPATAFVFWLCGIAPGLLVLVLSAATGFYIFTPPNWSWSMSWQGFLSVSSYVLSSLLVAWVVVHQRRATAQMLVSKKQLRAIINEQSDIVCRFDGQGRLLFANEASRRMFGLDDSTLARTTWQSIVWPEDLPAVLRQLKQLSPSQPTVLTENRIRLVSGEWRWAEFTNTAIFDDEGKLHEVQSVGRDMTDRKALEQQLNEASERLQDLYDKAPCGYYSLDPQGRFLQVNDTTLSWLGCSRREEVLGLLGPRDFFTPEGVAQFDANFPVLMARGHVGPLEFDLLGRDGRLRRVSVQATALRDAAGAFLMSRTVMYDVTELDRVRDELQRANREQGAMLHSDLIGIAKTYERKIIWANVALARMFHYRPDELIDAPTRLLYLDDATHQAFGETAFPVLRKGETYRTQMQMACKGGEPIWVDISGTQLSEKTGESLWMMLDISEMKNHQTQIERLASHDALTGLPNRRLLADRLQQGRLYSQRLEVQLAVCFIDLDGFKAVNDLHGHAAGDHLLRVIAARLQTCVRGNDTVARLGGDEFVLLLAHLHKREECVAILERTLKAVGEPVPLPGGALARVSASIGVAMYPAHAGDDATLMTQADAAMYKAKRAGRNQMHFGA